MNGSYQRTGGTTSRTFSESSTTYAKLRRGDFVYFSIINMGSVLNDLI